MLSLPRLIVALRTGAMRYGIFVWDKAPEESGNSRPYPG
jgi:tocopherol O-methyltransferase